MFIFIAARLLFMLCVEYVGVYVQEPAVFGH